MDDPKKIFTIGHSTHPIQEFLGMLAANGVTTLVDVRTVAGSRHNPQFGESELALSLTDAGIGYHRITALGGLRSTPKAVTSINGAWRNTSFRAYADYMQTPPVCSRTRRTHEVGCRAVGRDHVRRSSSVALPPVPHIRCPFGARDCGCRHHEPYVHKGAHLNQVRSG